MAGFVQPVADAMGTDGAKFIRTFISRTQFSIILSVSALVSTVCGLLMFWDISGGLLRAWLFSLQGLVLGIGSLAGIVAFLLGISVQRNTASRITDLGHEMDSCNTPPTADQLAMMQVLQKQMKDSGKWAAILLLVSIIGMSLARYV